MAGLFVGVYPYLPVWRPGELGHLRAYVFELLMDVLGRGLSIPLMRAVHSPAAVILIFIALGMGAGLAFGLAARKGWPLFRVFAFSLAGASSAFCLAFLMAWGKTLFFYPASTILSWTGAAVAAAALILSGLAGLILFVLLKLNRTASLAVLSAAVLFTLGVLFIGRGGTIGPESRRPARVVLIGVDSADWRVMLPLIREGRLTHLAGLMAEGTFGDLRSNLKTESPVIWTTIATGVRKNRHGIRGFVTRRKETGELTPISIADRRVEAVWDIASVNGKTTDVLGWYGTKSGEKVNGCFVAIRLGAEGMTRTVYPAERRAEMEALLAPDPILGTNALVRLGEHLLARDVPDLMLAYFPALDPIQHQDWKFYAADRGSRLARWISGPVSPLEVSEKGRAVEAEYLRIDEGIGRLVQAAGPGAAVFLVSDHGMGPARGPVTLNLSALLEKLGWLFLRPDGGGIDFSKTLLFDATDRNSTRRLIGDLRPNIREESPLRTGSGAPGQDRFLEAAEKSLAGLRTESGRKVFRKVHRSRDPETGAGRIHVWPNLGLDREDVVAVGGERLPVSSFIGLDALSGMHRMEGFLLARGPGIRKGYRIKDASVLDITPTLLYFLGLPQARDLEGRLLTSLIEPGLLSAEPVRWKSTYETGRRREPAEDSPKADRKTLETLRALGYIR